MNSDYKTRDPDVNLSVETIRSKQLQWSVIVFCAAIIVIGHLLEEARAYGWTVRIFPKHWEYIYRFADTSVAIAFAILVCWVIWFSRNNLIPLIVTPILSFFNWSENELKSRAFFGGFFRTIDRWQWAVIDASVSILVAVLLKPIVQRIAVRTSGVRSLSIADLFLATLASATLIMATRSIATLPASPDNPKVLFCGWPQTLLACVTAATVLCVAAAAIYILIAEKLRYCLLTYVVVWVIHVGAAHSLTISNGRISLKSFEISNCLLQPSDPYVAILIMFGGAMLTIRYLNRAKQVVEFKDTASH